MHIILGLLGSIVTILILLNRLAEAGIDLGGLNPFLWHRRRQWRKQYDGDPIYKISNPMDLTALLMVAVAKSDGDMSTEEKKKILELFQSEFHLSKRNASELMIASVYLLKDGSELRSNLKKVLQPSLDRFSQEQAQSALSLVNRVAAMEHESNAIKQELVGNITASLAPAMQDKHKWQTAP